MAETESGKPKFGVVRIILILVLISAVGALIYDYRARSQCKSVYNALQPLLPQDGKDSPNVSKDTEVFTSRDAVLKTIGRKPDKSQKEGGGLQDTFIWPGVFYVYELKVQFSGADQAFLREETVTRSRFSR